VLPRVQYGMAYPLIMDVVGSVPCSDEWDIGVVTHLGSHGATGILSIAMVLRLPYLSVAYDP
jgi:hypothetical protein